MVAIQDIGTEQLSTPQYQFCPDAYKQVLVQPNMEALFPDIKDCCIRDHLRYQSQMMFSILNVQTTLMLSTKFQLMFLGKIGGQWVWTHPLTPALKITKL